MAIQIGSGITIGGGIGIGATTGGGGGGGGGTTSYTSQGTNYNSGGVIITQFGGNKLIINPGAWTTSTATILALPSSTVIDVVYSSTNYELTLTSAFTYNSGQDWYEATYTSLTPTPGSPLDGFVTTISFTSGSPISYTSGGGNYNSGGVIITQIGSNKLIINSNNWTTSTATILALPSSTVIDVVYFGSTNYELTLTSGFVYNAGQDWYEATYTSLTPTPGSPLDGYVTTISFTA
jgi:uncharacterized protein YceK